METVRLTSGGFEMPVDAWSFIGVLLEFASGLLG